MDDASSMDSKRHLKWHQRKRAQRLAAFSVFLLSLAGLLLALGSRAGFEVRADSLRLSTVQYDSFQEFVGLASEVIPRETVFLDAVEGGIVERVFMEPGIPVRRGDTIVTFANSSLLLELTEREALLLENQNNLINTRFAMDRNSRTIKETLLDMEANYNLSKRGHLLKSTLFSKELISRYEFQRSRDSLQLLEEKRELSRLARAQDSIFRDRQSALIDRALASTEANLSILQEIRSHRHVISHTDGLLTRLTAEVGQSVPPGTRIGEIDEQVGFLITAQVDEYYLSRVHIGQTGHVALNGRDMAVTVSKIYPQVSDRTFRIDLEFADGVGDELRRGQTVRVRLELGSADSCLVLEKGGFFQSTGGHWVYVLDSAGETAARRNIEIGRQNPWVLEILGGLAPGERVITSSYDSFKDAKKLTLVRRHHVDH